MDNETVTRPTYTDLVAVIRELTCECEHNDEHDEDYSRTCDETKCPLCKARDYLARIDYPGEAA